MGRLDGYSVSVPLLSLFSCSPWKHQIQHHWDRYCLRKKLHSFKPSTKGVTILSTHPSACKPCRLCAIKFLCLEFFWIMTTQEVLSLKLKLAQSSPMLLPSQSSLPSFEGMDDKNYLHTWKGGEQSNVRGGFADAPPERHLCRFSLPRKETRGQSSLLYYTPLSSSLRPLPRTPLQLY